MSLGLDSRLAQTLVYGGIAISLAMYCWRWPTFGGVIAVIYGIYKLLGNQIYTPNLFTLIPVTAYLVIYGLFFIGGILSTVGGFITKATTKEESNLSRKLHKLAVFISLSSVIMAALYAFGVAIFIMYGSPPNPPDYLVASVFYLVPLLLVLIYISWKKPAQGGLIELIVVIPVLIIVMGTRWEIWLIIPYVIFCLSFIFGGLLNIASDLSRRNANI